MSNKSKICFLILGLSLAVMAATYYLVGVWIPALYIPLALGGLSFVAAVIFDIKLYIEFFTMRTTKHGMNMGALILLAFGLVVCLNYLSIRHNKTFDLTEEKLNSLSDQSFDVLKGLKKDLQLIVFYKGQEGEEQRQALKQTLNLYQENSGRLRVRFVNSYTDNLTSQMYLNELPDKDRAPLFAFVENDGRRIRIDSPFGEEQITGALIKATREGEKKIYFIKGHGERDLDATDGDGLSGLKQSLLSSSFLVEPLSLFDSPTLPEDAHVVAVVGPTSQYLDAEIQALRDFARTGGRLLIAIDPGQRHNLALLTKTFGVEFANNYVINEIGQMVGGGAASALGLEFDATSEITRRFPTGRNFAVFDFASELLRDSAKAESLKVTELVRTHNSSFTITELSNRVKPNNMAPRTVAMQVTGTLSSDVQGAPPPKEIGLVVVGDSDFLTNKALGAALNRDLALNMFAFLANESDLITIRPKQPKGTKMMMTSNGRLGVVVAGVSLPLVLLMASILLWYRRRGA